MIEYQVNESELLAAIAELKTWEVVKTLHKALKGKQDAVIELEFSYNMKDIYLLATDKKTRRRTIGGRKWR